MDSGNPHNFASSGTSRSTRTSIGRFRVDFTLITQVCGYIVYGIGTPMQNIKCFSGWARELDLVPDYIDPIVLPSPGAWQLYGFTTLDRAPPIVTRQSATNGANEHQQNLSGHIGNIGV
jgi:hypothetical protein